MSDFTKAAETITSFLENYNFSIVESYKNYVRYASKHAIIAIGYDERDNSYFTIVGDTIENLIPLDAINLTDVFGYSIEKYAGKPLREFFVDFFSTKGQPILLGAAYTIFEQLRKNCNERAKKATDDLLKRQNLTAADKAWESENYRDFIKHLDLIDRTALPKSYDLKYAIAQKRLGIST